MIQADYVTVAGFTVTFRENLFQTIFFYSYENCVRIFKCYIRH